MLSLTNTGRETLTRPGLDVPGPVILFCTTKSVSTPVVLELVIHVREKEVPALRVVLRLRRKVRGETGAGTVRTKIHELIINKYF